MKKYINNRSLDNSRGSLPRMKKRFTKYTIILFLGIFFLSFVQAENLPPQFKDRCVTLSQTCDNCTYVNITKMKYPNSTEFYPDWAMSTPNYINYNYSFCSLEQSGTYVVTTCGDIDGILTCVDYKFDASATGNEYTTGKSVTYFLIFFISLIIFVGLLIIGISLPIGNKRDEMTGYILAVSNLKYVKLLCLGLAYLVAMFISYFSWMVLYAYLDMDFATTIFRFIFTAQAILVLPLFILFVYLTIANLIRDSQVSEALQRGFTKIS